MIAVELFGIWVTAKNGFETRVDIYCGRYDFEMGRIIPFRICYSQQSDAKGDLITWKLIPRSQTTTFHTNGKRP